MPNPPPRKRFQIHLSTAIVLMFVAGGLLGMNCMDRGEYDSAMFGHFAHSNGVFGLWYGQVVKNGQIHEHYNPLAMATNFVFGVVCLGAVGYLSEWLIRRTARKVG